MDDFRYMMLKNVNALTESEIRKLANIRRALPKPSEKTLMQKVIPADDIEQYISGQYFGVQGSIAIASDAKHLKTFEDYYYGLRLDYKNTKFHISRNSCGVIRFKSSKTPQNIVIPKGGTFDNWAYPFTSTGFTSGNNGRLGIPEWNLLQRIDFEDDAELWEVYSNGQEVLRAVFKNNKFHAIK